MNEPATGTNQPTTRHSRLRPVLPRTFHLGAMHHETRIDRRHFLSAIAILIVEMFINYGLELAAAHVVMALTLFWRDLREAIRKP